MGTAVLLLLLVTNAAYGEFPKKKEPERLLNKLRAIQKEGAPKEDPSIRGDRGRAHLQRGQYDDAIADLEHAVGTSPEGEAAYGPILAAAYLGRGRARIGAGQPGKAVEDLRHGAELEPDNAAIYSELSLAHARQNQFSQCVDAATRALALNAKIVEAWTNRGACRSGLGEVKKALSDINKAIELKPSAEAHMQRAAILSAENDCKKAREDADKAARLKPDLKAVRGDFLGQCAEGKEKAPHGPR